MTTKGVLLETSATAGTRPRELSPQRPAVRPKILHVTQATGGIETILTLLLRHFDHARFEHHLSCPPGTALESRARDLGIPVHPVKMVRNARPVRDLGNLFELVRIMRREGYAVVHGYSAKGGYLGRLAARLAGVPSVLYSPQAFSYLSQRQLARAVFLRMERLAIPWTDLLVAASESERRRATEEVGFDSSRVVIVPNSIDPDELEGLGRLEQASPAVVLTVGRLIYQKNPEMFVRVAALVAAQRPDVQFVWLGAGFAGPLERRVRTLIEAKGLSHRITILSWAERRDTLRAIAQCAVFVLTSRFEGMPNTLLEALMLRRPVVATAVDGSRDVFHSGGGHTVPLDDDAAMAERIGILLDNPKEAEALADMGYRNAMKCFEIGKNVRRLEELYAETCAAVRSHGAGRNE